MKDASTRVRYEWMEFIDGEKTLAEKCVGAFWNGCICSKNVSPVVQTKDWQLYS